MQKYFVPYSLRMVALSSIFERLVLLEAEARCPPSKRGRTNASALQRITAWTPATSRMRLGESVSGVPELPDDVWALVLAPPSAAVLRAVRYSGTAAGSPSLHRRCSCTPTRRASAAAVSRRTGSSTPPTPPRARGWTCTGYHRRVGVFDYDLLLLEEKAGVVPADATVWSAI